MQPSSFWFIPEAFLRARPERTFLPWVCSLALCFVCYVQPGKACCLRSTASRPAWLFYKLKIPTDLLTCMISVLGWLGWTETAKSFPHLYRSETRSDFAPSGETGHYSPMIMKGIPVRTSPVLPACKQGTLEWSIRLLYKQSMLVFMHCPVSQKISCLASWLESCDRREATHTFHTAERNLSRPKDVARNQITSQDPSATSYPTTATITWLAEAHLAPRTGPHVKERRSYQGRVGDRFVSTIWDWFMLIKLRVWLS